MIRLPKEMTLFSALGYDDVFLYKDIHRNLNEYILVYKENNNIYHRFCLSIDSQHKHYWSVYFDKKFLDEAKTEDEFIDRFFQYLDKTYGTLFLHTWGESSKKFAKLPKDRIDLELLNLSL